MQSVKKDVIDADAMLRYAGDFGRYQFRLMLLFGLINVLSAFHYFGQTFLSVVSNFECKLPKGEDPSFATVGECSITYNNTGNETVVTPCKEGWVYDNTYSYNYISIVQQFDWVCNDDWIPAMGQSMFFVGSVVGSLGFGILADRVGRLHVLIISNMMALFGNLTTLISSNVIVFAASRFVAGCATDSNFVMMYIIVMEYIRPSMRTFGLNICIGVFYCVSCMVVPWLAVILGNWKWFLLAIAVPHIIVLSFYFMVPESAQWLMSKNEIGKAIVCFRRIADINKKIISEDIIKGLEHYSSENIVEKSNESLWGLVKTPKLRRKTCILIFKSMVMTLGYDAISRNVNGFGFSPFTVFTVTSSTILPACVFILLTQDRVGRKALASGALFISGLFTIFAGVILATTENPSPMIITSIAIIARLTINVAYNSGAQYAVELIPTVVRGQGVSAVHVMGYVASFFSPQILYLANIWNAFPDIILGVLLILGAISCLFLPETLDRTLPVTLKDGEDFGENEGCFDFYCCSGFSESTQTLKPDQYPENYVSSKDVVIFF